MTTGTGSISAIAAYEANSQLLAHSPKSQAQPFVGQDPEPLTAETTGNAMERAHMATERHLHAWLVTGAERHLDLAKAHIDQLIALYRIHHERSNP